MSNIKTPVESFEFVDLEDNTKIHVHVESFTEVGNAGKPGLQVLYLGNIVCFEPLMAAKLAKANRGAVSLFGLQPTVREVFAISGFDKVVTIRDDEASALAAVGG
jgi:hypothetical protein